MTSGIYEGVQAMAAAEARLQSVATNLANLDVHGYKRRASATTAFEARLGDRVGRQIATRTVVDHDQGSLTQTGNPFDLALSGKGFFAVETEHGEAYTRNGRFRVDDEGVLQTHAGEPVAWQGARGTVDPLGEDVRVDPEGVVFQGEARVGQLRIANFRAVEMLQPAGDGNFHRARGQQEAAHQAVVRQGFVERANVNAIDEMVSMIAIQRSFESSARLMNMIDQTYRRLTQAR